jgi:hypothetical protein
MSIQINGYNVIDNDINVNTTTKISSSTCNIPSGTTLERPSLPATGSIRYNTTDSGIEYYNGTTWIRFKSQIPLSFAARGVFGGGTTGPGVVLNTMEYITISSASNSTPFGNLSSSKTNLSSCSSQTRGIFASGINSPGTFLDTIDYITISSASNSTPFGTITPARQDAFGTSNSTIGIFGGGNTPTAVLNVRQITIATTGNATPFATLGSARAQASAMGTPTTAYIAGGIPTTTSIEYSLFASGGAWASFGSLGPSGKRSPGSFNNQTRGLIAGGINSTPTTSSTIEYITFATLSSSSSFGNLNTARNSFATVSIPTRGVSAGGFFSPTTYSSIEYINDLQIRSNGISFGSLSTTIRSLSGCSNGHAGLGY